MTSANSSLITATISRVRQQRPLVHYVPNIVSAELVANALLAWGAAPVMAWSLDDARCLQAQAIALNLGTLTAERSAMLLALGQHARAHSIPLVLDPVGVATFPARRTLARQLIEQGGVTLVCGNAAEIAALAELPYRAYGIDSSTQPLSAHDCARLAFDRLGCTIALTGSSDSICSASGWVQVHGGHPWLGLISGTGCVATGLIAAALGVEHDPLLAAHSALAALKAAGDYAAQRAAGPGSAKQQLIDGLYTLSPSTVSSPPPQAHAALCEVGDE